MAKATKSDNAGEPASKKSPATKPTAGKEAAKKAPAAAKSAATKPASGPSKKPGKSEKPASGQPRLAPLIDTGLAAQAAASMIANRVVAGTGAASGRDSSQAPAKQESSSFKNLKEGISKPSSGGLGAILGGGSGQTKLHQGFGGPKPSVPGGAKNQTFGADVNRAGVPRRTGG